MGGDGVRKALSLIREELKVSMSLTGVRDVRDASPDILFDRYDGSRR
jgi:isopentenyl diphosphate isomerase/L-lactate dehydrogenase-like FMN-dependent dehydrogenase